MGGGKTENSVILLTVERLAKLEVRMDNLVEQVKHIDLCVDSLKMAIWYSSGAIAVVVFLAGWVFK